MSGRVLRAASFLLLAACGQPAGTDGGVRSDAGSVGTGVQGSYEYPGCQNQETGCPRLLTLYCALDAITASHAACDDDGDCALSVLTSKCSGYPDCPIGVSASRASEFHTRAQAEIDRYCLPDGGGCFASGGCPHADNEYSAFCINGQCRARLHDGGL